MTRADKALVLLPRFVGVGALFALVAVFMPVSWMAATHHWLGLGEVPTAPVVEYLARYCQIMDDPAGIGRRERVLIATVVSKVNGCLY